MDKIIYFHHPERCLIIYMLCFVISFNTISCSSPSPYCTNESVSTMSSVDDDDHYSKAMEPLFQMTNNWLEVVQPETKGSILKKLNFNGKFLMHKWHILIHSTELVLYVCFMTWFISLLMVHLILAYTRIYQKSACSKPPFWLHEPKNDALALWTEASRGIFSLFVIVRSLKHWLFNEYHMTIDFKDWIMISW